MWKRLVRGAGLSGLAAMLTCSFMAQSLYAAETGRRQIEEVVVTAERKEASISDTSISISAFTGEFLEDFGIRNQEDLQNLIPAAVIEPYDMAIRGVGRNFRALGGDPGVATYFNGVYSEDFGIASTEGGLFDVERIEVLRGPQGTLYGRNAIGGAVNFISKLPSDEFEGEARVVLGDYDLQETYGVVSGPLVQDVLSARLVGVKRTRDGYYKDLSPAPDAGNYGDENYALGLRWTPTDSIEINTRGNERSYRRRMAGADAAGIVNFNELGLKDTDVDGNGDPLVRDNQTYVFGYRAVDANADDGIAAVQCSDAFHRTVPIVDDTIVGGVGCQVPGLPTYNFVNPVNGNTVVAQRFVPGVDGGDPVYFFGGAVASARHGFSTTDHPNEAYGTDLSRQRMLGLYGIEGSDLKTDTNGHQDEYFDHQANSTDVSWQVNDQFSVKYIFGYTDYFYDRTSDVDLTSNEIFDNQFYVSQETEYVSHELQFFWDPTDSLSITSGMFAYDAKITQRGDFYDSLGPDSRYASDFPYAVFGGPIADFGAFVPKVDLFTSRKAGVQLARNGTPLPATCLTGATINAADQLDIYCYGSWDGDTGDRIAHGPPTVGTNLEYQTRTEREAYAFYTQGEYTINDHFSLTLGARWARDELDGEENVFYYSESDIIPLGFPGVPGTYQNAGVFPSDPVVCPEEGCESSLADINQALGFLGPNGEILNPQRMLVAGIPASQSLWRRLDREDQDITWRANLDWTPTDDDLIYVSATSGFRAGGYNLNTFASNAKYAPEHLIAYEIGYKGTMLDGQLQVNTAVYFYDYENVHTYGSGPAFSGGYSTGVFAVPKGEMIGWDGDVTWLPTDELQVGVNFSYTHSEYTESFEMISPNDPGRPASLFNALSTEIDIDGNQMLRVPEMKGGAYAQYTVPLDMPGRTEVLVNYSWIDKVYFSVFEDDASMAPAYDRWDLRVSWLSDEEDWTVAAFCNNVLDEIGIRQNDHYGATEESNYRHRGHTTDPRLIGLEVRYKFGAYR